MFAFSARIRQLFAYTDTSQILRTNKTKSHTVFIRLYAGVYYNVFFNISCGLKSSAAYIFPSPYQKV